MRVRSDGEDDLVRSEDGEGGLDVWGVGLDERFSNAMPAARDINDFCKRAKAKIRRVV
jgi:hypothetical protein